MTKGGEPLGARWRDGGVDFRLWAPAASSVALCLYDGVQSDLESDRLELTRSADGWWTARVEGGAPGLVYGYRVAGDHAPEHGAFFDPAKLLVDPRAAAVTRGGGWHPSLLTENHLDSGPWAPRSVVVDPSFDWRGDTRPEIPWGRTVIYECHVGGLTRRHPDVRPELRGTYLGIAEPAVIEHLQRLGVTSVELLPVQHFLPERHLAETGRINYWGYSPIAWLAPHAGFARAEDGRQVAEFKEMVRALHRAGLEVILDVVLNHTAEGGAGGLTVGPRGIDNRGFYRLDPTDPSRYVDFTGCGNTVDARPAETRRLLLDVLRYWAGEMRVDGFRFDLAPVLGRRDDAFEATAPFFREIAADPVLAGRKLIAEPWDLGPGGSAEGAFPEGWREWNGRCRDALRSFWRGDAASGRELATRLAGSADLYGKRRSGALTGVNFVACHDGFTLRDLVSYSRKHNEANGENNRDGSNHNLSRNWGFEGPTDDPAILLSRQKVQKALLASLTLCAGIPMLGHGDEIGRTQHGNNNAYCHDSELTWVDWRPDDAGRDLLAFIIKALELRRELGLFDRASFFSPDELVWLRPDGRPMTDEDWNGEGPRTLILHHRPAAGRHCLAVLHGGDEPSPIRLPAASGWRLRLASVELEDPVGPELRVAPYSVSVWTGDEPRSGDEPGGASPPLG